MKHVLLVLTCLLSLGAAQAQMTIDWANKVEAAMQPGRIRLAYDDTPGFIYLGLAANVGGAITIPGITYNDSDYTTVAGIGYNYLVLKLDTLGDVDVAYKGARTDAYGQQHRPSVGKFSNSVYLGGSASQPTYLDTILLPVVVNNQEAYEFRWANDGTSGIGHRAASSASQVPGGISVYELTSISWMSTFTDFPSRRSFLTVFDLPTGATTPVALHSLAYDDTTIGVANGFTPWIADFGSDDRFLVTLANKDIALRTGIPDSTGLPDSNINTLNFTNYPQMGTGRGVWLQRFYYDAIAGFSAPDEPRLVAYERNNSALAGSMQADAGDVFFNFIIPANQDTPGVVLNPTSTPDTILTLSEPFSRGLLAVADTAGTLLNHLVVSGSDDAYFVELALDDTAVYTLVEYQTDFTLRNTTYGDTAATSTDFFRNALVKLDRQTLDVEEVFYLPLEDNGGGAGMTARGLEVRDNGWIFVTGTALGVLKYTATDSITLNRYQGGLNDGFLLGIKQVPAGPVGLSEAPSSIEHMQVFPNPASGAVTVRSRLAQPAAATLSLRNALGQEVYRTTSAAATEHSLRIRTEGLAPGLYFVTVAAGNQQRTERLIVR